MLGIESSCDETAASVLRREPCGRTEILSDHISSQVEDHAPFGGVVPEIAARQHAQNMDHLIRMAMMDAKLGFDELDAVAATSGPGLVGGVLVGMMSAKAIAMAAGIPFIGINHLEGHALSPMLAGGLKNELQFPYLLLLVSGGHTQLLAVEDFGRYHRLGSTLDDAAGEAFDKTAKIMGLGFPGGPAVEQMAKNGNAQRFALPRPLVRKPGCDFSFAGLKTAVQRAWENCERKSEQDKADLAASFQQAAIDILVIQSAKAMRAFKQQYGDGSFVVAGGVAANNGIRTALQSQSKRAEMPFIAPPLRYCTDNAAMIALAGIEHLQRGHSSPLDLAARPRWPLDEHSARLQPVSGSGKKGPKS